MMKVFISWSGATSRSVAETLRDWLPKVVQGIEPFVSAKDIDKGANWTAELARELEDAEFGIICLTPENLTSPWLHYEAGAITKSVNSRVSPILFGVKKEQVQAPMAQLQLTDIDQEEFVLLMESINKTAGGTLTTNALKEAVEVWWPRLKESLGQIGVPEVGNNPVAAVASEPAKPAFDVLEMMAEVLQIVRNLSERLHRVENPAPTSPPPAYRWAKNSLALRHLQKRLQEASIDLLSHSLDETVLRLTLNEPLPDPLPTALSEAVHAVVHSEDVDVEFESPGRLILFKKDGHIQESLL